MRCNDRCRACRRAGSAARGAAWPRAGGFTLLEVLLAVSILAIVATLLYASFHRSFETTERVAADAVPYDQARAVFEIVGRELSSAVWSASDARTAFSGTEKNDGSRRMDELSFTTDGHVRVVPGAAETARSRVSYFLDASAGKGTYRLIHQEETNLLSRTRESVQALAMAEDVSSFGLDYYDGATWRRSWESAKDRRIPAAVRVTVSFKAAEGMGEDRSFMTVFVLPSLAAGS